MRIFLTKYAAVLPDISTLNPITLLVSDSGALHTHIHRRYNKSPRLAILSPVPNCGKSTVLNILNSIVWNPEKLIDPTTASTFRLAGDHTLLLDEVDNMSIMKSMKSMKAILNNGHEIGEFVPRTGENGKGGFTGYTCFTDASNCSD
jgi:hypothetical protein